jgi:hypothetical protein
MDVPCPIWYSKLTKKVKIHIKDLIGNATKSSTRLENYLIDSLGTDRTDIQDLLMWWFSMDSVVCFFFGGWGHTHNIFHIWNFFTVFQHGFEGKGGSKKSSSAKTL